MLRLKPLLYCSHSIRFRFSLPLSLFLLWELSSLFFLSIWLQNTRCAPVIQLSGIKNEEFWSSYDVWGGGGGGGQARPRKIDDASLRSNSATMFSIVTDGKFCWQFFCPCVRMRLPIITTPLFPTLLPPSSNIFDRGIFLFLSVVCRLLFDYFWSR